MEGDEKLSHDTLLREVGRWVGDSNYSQVSHTLNIPGEIQDALG